jgi:hypothetical protein
MTNLDEARDELRLALVLNGGVSLAVWMSGVVAEIDAVRYSGSLSPGDVTPPVYRRLCEELALHVQTDIIAGTSAGGLNGALLAAGIVTGKRVSGIRGTWLASGSLESLLRSPQSEEVPSLLDGDGGLLPAVSDALGRYFEPPVEEECQGTVRLILTGTDLFGVKEPSFADSYGREADRVEYRLQFRFRADSSADSADDGFLPGRWAPLTAASVPALARAARTSSSFPFAFEPSTLSGDDPVLAMAAQTRGGTPVFAGGEPVTRWAMDGGVLDNSPIEPVLTTIKARHSGTPTRRAIVFIVPYGGATTLTVPTKSDANLRRVLNGVFNVPREIPLLDDLSRVSAEISRHNECAQNIDQSLSEMAPEILTPLARGLLPIYRERVFVATLRDSGLDPTPDPQLMGAAEWLPVDGSVPGDGGYRLSGEPVRRAGRRALDRIRRARAALPVPIDSTRKDRASALAEARDGLRTAQAKVHDAIRRAAATPPIDAKTLRKAGGPNPKPKDVAKVVNELSTWSNDHRDTWETALRDVAQAFVDARKAVADLAGFAHETRTALLVEEQITNTPDFWAAQLLLVDIVTRGIADCADERETSDVGFTFARVCADGPHPGERDGADVPPAAKLYGLELGHFAGFVRPSWRANDWLWGRLDGAARIIETLLAPTRLHEHPLTGVQLFAALTDGIADSDRPYVVQQLEQADPTAGALEPGEADDSPSEALTRWRAAFRLRVQLLILREELPKLKEQISTDVVNGFLANGDSSLDLVGEDASGSVLVDSFETYTQRLATAIPRRVADEVRSDEGARLAATALAVATSAAGSSSSGFPLTATAALRAVRGVVQTARFAVFRMTGTVLERSMFVVGLALAGLAIGVSVSTDLGPGSGSGSVWKGIALAIGFPVVVVGVVGVWRPTGRGVLDRIASLLLAAGCLSALVALVLALWAHPVATSQKIADKHELIFLIVMLVALSTAIGWIATSTTSLTTGWQFALFGVLLIGSIGVYVRGEWLTRTEFGNWIADHSTLICAAGAAVLIVVAWILGRRQRPPETPALMPPE